MIKNILNLLKIILGFFLVLFGAAGISLGDVALGIAFSVVGATIFVFGLRPIMSISKNSRQNKKTKNSEPQEKFEAANSMEYKRFETVKTIAPIIIQDKTPDVHRISESVKASKGNVSAEKIDLHRITDMRNLKNYIVLDCETTGFSEITDRIVEIAIVTVSDGKVSDEYSTLINPERSIPVNASKVNHITDDMVENAPLFSDIWPELKSKIGENIIFAHNASFDIKFLSKSIERCGDDFSIKYVDTMSFSRKSVPGIGSYRLENLIKHFEPAQCQDHRALSDARFTNEILNRCINIRIKNHEERLASSKAKREKEKEERERKYENSPLLNKIFVFTGRFELDRNSLENMTKSVGAILKQSMVKKADFLVVGDLEGYQESTLQKKFYEADRLAAEGSEIKKLNEQEYLAMIYGAREQLQKTNHAGQQSSTTHA